MDIGLLERSETMKPLLVRLYDTHHIYSLAENQSPDARSKLSDIVSELLDVSVEAREKDLVADILLALIQQAEIQLRQELSEKIAALPNVPARLILNLAYDEISVAESVLRYSPVLETLDLMYILQSKPHDYARVIASRPDLPSQIIDELASIDDTLVHSVLAANDEIKLTVDAMKVLYVSAQKNESVAQPLIERADVPKTLVKKLYSFVGEHLKVLINDKYGLVGDDIDEVIDASVKTLSEPKPAPAPQNPFMPTRAMMDAEYAKSQLRSDRDGHMRNVMFNEMLGELRLKNYRLFVAKFSIFMGVSAKDTLEVLGQQYGHGLAILCRSHGVDRNDFIKLFLLSEHIRSNGQAMQGITLNRALSYFDRMNTEFARNIYQRNFVRA